MNDAGKNPDRPNVLLICCDQLRADWLSCNGHPIVMTPQIDALATEGVNFRRALSECPVCIPARRILMTGRGPYHIGMDDTSLPFTLGPKVAEMMTRAGYQTFAAGKMHTTPPRNRLGFEEIQLNEEGRRGEGMERDDYEMFLEDNGYAHRAYTHGMGNNQYGMRLSPLPEAFTTTHWTAQKAMEFVVRRDPLRPFFLYVSFDKPHPPVTPPQEYYELYRDVEFPQPVWGEWLAGKTTRRITTRRTKHLWDFWKDNPLMVQQTLRGFAAMITHIDSMIGVLLGTLREAGLLENTLVIFTADHGDQLFDHGSFAKSDFFRGAANVPFIVRPPKGWGKRVGTRRDAVDTHTPVGLMDVMPTILDICDVEIPETVQGQSVAKRLVDDEAPFRTYSFGKSSAGYAVNDGTMKYQWYSDSGIELLFNQDEDPGDLHDLSEDPASQATLERMRRELIQWMSTHGDRFVVDGELTHRPRKEQTVFFPRTGWNNRGRH